jgi:hypothetical protein
MARLKNTEKFENIWFYNCNVYAKPDGKSRIRYDIFDNIEYLLLILSNEILILIAFIQKKNIFLNERKNNF